MKKKILLLGIQSTVASEKTSVGYNMEGCGEVNIKDVASLIELLFNAK